MIDCENEVFDRVSKRLAVEYPTATCKSEYVRTPSSFPHVYLFMSDNALDAGRTTDEREFALPMFQIEIYSNLVNGKKSECKKIAKIIDSEMYSMNFERIVASEVPNLNNSTVYRYVLRYSGETDGTFFYRR